ncbi:MAG: P-loop NTPase, partial [Planctomycetota bacterium]
MPVITIASGKGGTGKTTLAVNLAQVLGSQGLPVHLMDCDVEEPNDQLFTRARFAEVETVTVMKPRWQASACIGCGRCVAACAFNALSLINEQIHIHGELCHACGVCSHVCEHAALPEQAVAIGMIEAAPDHRPFAFSQGRLALGESQAPAVIRTLKRRQDPSAITLIDASPGTACPVVEAMRGSDMVLLVTEPTPFGLHDLRLAANLTAGMGLPTAIVVNRSDGVDRIIADFAADSGLPIAARIPFKRAYAESYARGELLAESFPEVAD